MLGKAFTRALSPRIGNCALTHQKRVPIDAVTATKQHAAYEQALRAAGLDVLRLPALPDYPDGVFVEDTAVLLDGHAIITRPGSSSRAGEAQSTAEALAAHFEVHRIDAGHVDGGDVLRIGQTLYVGVSSRTNRRGLHGLRDIAEKLDFKVVAAEAGQCLHLKTAVTVAGRDGAGNLVLLYNPDDVDPSQFAGVSPLPVAHDEPGAANVLSVGSHVIMPAGNTHTASLLGGLGIPVVELDVSELEKAEAGVTCMSLIQTCEVSQAS